ncbi:MAG: hypothetical protein ABIR05_02880 [Luteimonas sp.]
MRQALMAMLLACVLPACLVAIPATPAHAAIFKKSPEKAAAEAANAGASAVTIWVDATWGFRNQGAANDLSRAHKAFADQGYKVVSVAPYIENGDLEGFFVTYQKP